MFDFTVHPSALQKNASFLQNCRSSLRNLSADIRAIQGDLVLQGMAAFYPRKVLGSLSEDVLDEAAKAESLREALLHIVKAYQKTEEKITCHTRNAEQGAEYITDSPRSDRQAYINSYVVGNTWEILTLLIKYWNNPEKRAEAIQDHYMSYTAQNLLNKQEYSEQTWNSASLEERKTMLINLLDELNLIMGLQVTDYKFDNLGASTRGQYSSSTNSVTINLDYVDPANGRSDSYMVMRTMIHEMRHAYQHAAVNNPDKFNVSEETRKQWAANFNDYKSAKTDGYDAYVEQPIEYDAKRFAGQYQDIKGHTPTYAGTW